MSAPRPSSYVTPPRLDVVSFDTIVEERGPARGSAALRRRVATIHPGLGSAAGTLIDLGLGEAKVTVLPSHIGRG
jgi:hypothetical protein